MLKRVAISAFVIGIAAGLSGCGREEGVEAQAVGASISFDEGGCPRAVSLRTIKARRRQRIVWQAVDANGEMAQTPFELFFDPIRGNPLRAPAGRLSKSIDFRAPTVEYKYTIVGLRCPDKPLDPSLRIAR